MQIYKRILALLLIAAMALSLASGCSIFLPFATVKHTAAPPQTPAATPVPTIVPTPTEDIAAANSLTLAQLDMEIFDEYATSDALSFHLTVAHPENFAGLSSPETGWGPFTYEESRVATEQEKGWLDRLHAIDRDALAENERLTYDTLEQYLNWSIESFDYYYYGEVLDTLVGLHSNLPLNMVFYDMKSLEDVEGYLTLLADTPRIMGLVLKYEEEKSAAGLFMTDSALDEVLGQLQDVIDAKETLFLRATFGDAIADIEMSDEQRAAYEARNDELVDALVDSYQALYDGLEPLRGTCTNEAGLCAYGEAGLRYFELELNMNACSVISPQKAAEILQTEIDYQISVLTECMRKEPSVYDNFDQITLSVGTTEENLAYLETLMAGSFPELPEHAVTFMDCPEELEDQFSPAAYLVPPVDDASENLIILNAKTLEEDTRFLDTLAHEGYPGHMYHYQYLRTLVGQTGYARQVFDLTGYYECWSQAGEVFFDTYNTRFSNNYCRFMNANSTLGNLLLPALISIKVNCDGYSEEGIVALVAQYYDEETANELGGVYYKYAVENPFYFLKYAMGFTMFQQELRKAQMACGSTFDRLSYNKAFLDLGPTYFNFILPAMDEWIAANKPQ
ncbi:MAG TPA: DUF885 family protein [Clostridia bacterium]|nr:DUF885 family protein [Clostridia bacterium]